MCGICGLVKFPGEQVESKDVEAMVNTLKHRGPDDKGIYVKDNVGLGHTRLSIIDLSSAGHQPMIFDECIITYNGEVYNFQEIQSELIKIGYTFVSGSDTEVILKAYHAWGIACVDRFNGMFAFCIYDIKKSLLFLVRDRFGVKPVYYTTDARKITFASSIRALKATANFNDQVSTEAIENYLNFLYIPAPLTIYQNVKKLLPGHYLKVDLTTFSSSLEKYFELKIVEDNTSFSASVQQMDTLLNDAVAKRMISDVPVGVFLSGGVDSSIVCAMAAQQTGSKINTFSIGYGQEGKFFDESKYALAVAKKYNTNHVRFEVNFDNLLHDFDEVIHHMDEPNADTSVFLNHYISKVARQHVTVALSGVGGDELFGGYNRYQAFLIGRKFLSLPAIVQKQIRNFATRYSGGRSGKVANTIRAINKTLSSIDRHPATFYANLISYTSTYNTEKVKRRIDVNADLNSIMKFDIENYLPDDILSLTDQMSMASSLEVREPLLDYRLVEKAMTIKADKKVRLKEKKIVLKKVAERYMDKSIIYRRKQGFSAPIEPWLRSNEQDIRKQVLNNQQLLNHVSSAYLLDTIDGFYVNKNDLSLQVYSLVVLSKWLNANLGDA